MTNIPIRKSGDHRIFDQSSDQKIRWSLTSSIIPISKLDDHRIVINYKQVDKYSDQKIRLQWNGYETLEMT